MESHVFQPAFTVVLNLTFSTTHGTWKGPVTSWPQLLLYWELVVSITKTRIFWEPEGVFTTEGSSVVIHMSILQRALMEQNIFWGNGQGLKIHMFLYFSRKTFGWIKFLISQNYRVASLQILRPFTNCYHTCSTNEPSFVMGSCQVRFLVLIFDYSAITYSALDGTQMWSTLWMYFHYIFLEIIPGLCYNW